MPTNAEQPTQIVSVSNVWALYATKDGLDVLVEPVQLAALLKCGAMVFYSADIYGKFRTPDKERNFMHYLFGAKPSAPHIYLEAWKRSSVSYYEWLEKDRPQ